MSANPCCKLWLYHHSRINVRSPSHGFVDYADRWLLLKAQDRNLLHVRDDAVKVARGSVCQHLLGK